MTADDFKDIYAEGLTVGRAIGYKEGLIFAMALLKGAAEDTAAQVLCKHYDELLAEERKGAKP